MWKFQQACGAWPSFWLPSKFTAAIFWANGESSGRNPSNNHSEQKSISENAVYIPPTLIPPRILPLLHDLAQQMVQAGHQQQLLKIYR